MIWYQKNTHKDWLDSKTERESVVTGILDAVFSFADIEFSVSETSSSDDEHTEPKTTEGVSATTVHTNQGKMFDTLSS